MVTKTLKLEYKYKKLTVSNGEVIDENGEIVDLKEDLVKLFNGKEFSLTATLQRKDEFEMSDVSA